MESSSNNKSRISIGFTYNKKPALQHCKAGQYSERESNPHSFNGNRILSPACLPVPPSEQLGFVNETANLDKFAFICNLIMLNLRSLPFFVRNYLNSAPTRSSRRLVALIPSSSLNSLPSYSIISADHTSELQ